MADRPITTRRARLLGRWRRDSPARWTGERKGLSMIRIAVAGFQHETNSFGADIADLAAFERHDAWPGLCAGKDLIAQTAGINLPVTGFIEAAGAEPDVAVAPILWCAAEPSAPVTDHAFETIAARIVDGVASSGPIDGVYLDLHGAMIVDSFPDGEGELVRRVRAVVGAKTPIVISLDMHANVTADLVRLTDSICLYRTYPHIDMAETGARCLPLLRRAIAGARFCKAFRQSPYLIPLPVQFTGEGPTRRLYEALAPYDADPHVHAELAMGFTAADMADTGPSIIAYAETQAAADRIADELLGRFEAEEGRYDCAMLTPDQAVTAAMAATPGWPVVIADVQDNSGAGAYSDTTGMIDALIRGGAQGALVGVLHDAEAAQMAHQAGVGGAFDCALGGRSGRAGQGPLRCRVSVEALSDGECLLTGEMMRGSLAQMGPTAVLRIIDNRADVRVLVSSARIQCIDLVQFTHIGVDPAAARIVVVKSTAHFRADFEPIAQAVLICAAPGAFPCGVGETPFTKLRKGVRLGPGGPVWAG